MAEKPRQGWANLVFVTGSVITAVVTFVVGENKDGLRTPVKVYAT